LPAAAHRLDFDRNQVKSLIVLSPGETASADISYGVYGTPASTVTGTLRQRAPRRSSRFRPAEGTFVPWLAARERHEMKSLRT
jgi:hypothetical protein